MSAVDPNNAPVIVIPGGGGGGASIPTTLADDLLDGAQPDSFFVTDSLGTGELTSAEDALALINTSRVYLPASPVLRWECDEASGTTLANTGSASSANLTVSGSPYVGRPTQQGAAVVWTGNATAPPAEYARGATVVEPAQPITILAWVRPRAWTNGYAKIVYRAARGTWAAPTGHGLRLTGGGEAGVSAGGWAAEIAVGGAETTLDLGAPATRLQLGIWQLVALTYDNTNLRAYLDGQLVGTAAVAGALDYGSTGTRYWMVGANQDATVGSECFDGAIREVQVYGSALSAADLARIYQQGVGSYGA